MQVFNTLGRRLQPLEPRQPGKISIYTCGPTVQAAPHVGHGRQAVAFDMIRRYLEWRGYEVTYVVNVTDVDDKIIAEAARRGVEPAEVVAESETQFLSAYRRLGVRDPDILPHATDHIPEMIELIEQLVAGGHAYPADGDVYFSVKSFPDYGRLSGRHPDELLAGARVEPGEHKRDPADFALWKAAKEGEPSWDSPWGAGRPGWHIECSAMAAKYLGFGFDIHGGGLDLVFPHHENEVAQAEAAEGAAPFVRVWLHNGLVNLGGEKMSKSTGVVTDLAAALERWGPLAVRLFYLRRHYRDPLEFTEAALEDAAAQLERLWAFRRRVPGPVEGPADSAVVEAFQRVMDDDFNTAEGLAVLFEAVRDGNRRLDAGEDASGLVAAYDEIAAVLGLAEPPPALGDVAAALDELAMELGLVTGAGPEAVVGELLAHRDRARAAADYPTADLIRERLAALDVVVEDGPDGARWHRR